MNRYVLSSWLADLLTDLTEFWPFSDLTTEFLLSDLTWLPAILILTSFQLECYFLPYPTVTRTWCPSTCRRRRLAPFSTRHNWYIYCCNNVIGDDTPMCHVDSETTPNSDLATVELKHYNCNNTMIDDDSIVRLQNYIRSRSRFARASGRLYFPIWWVDLFYLFILFWYRTDMRRLDFSGDFLHGNFYHFLHKFSVNPYHFLQHQ